MIEVQPATDPMVQEPEGDAKAESKALAAPPIAGNPTYVVSRRAARDRIAEWVVLRAQGMRNVEIAAKMGIQASSLSTLINRAVKQGWLQFESPADRLEHELAPMVVDNVRDFLIAKDKQVTLEAAKGLGLFKTHSALKVEGDQASTVFAIKIDMIEPTVARAGGVIVGTPKLPGTLPVPLLGSVIKSEGE